MGDPIEAACARRRPRRIPLEDPRCVGSVKIEHRPSRRRAAARRPAQDRSQRQEAAELPPSLHRSPNPDILARPDLRVPGSVRRSASGPPGDRLIAGCQLVRHGRHQLPSGPRRGPGERRVPQRRISERRGRGWGTALGISARSAEALRHRPDGSATGSTASRRSAMPTWRSSLVTTSGHTSNIGRSSSASAAGGARRVRRWAARRVGGERNGRLRSAGVRLPRPGGSRRAGWPRNCSTGRRSSPRSSRPATPRSRRSSTTSVLDRPARRPGRPRPGPGRCGAAGAVGGHGVARRVVAGERRRTRPGPRALAGRDRRGHRRGGAEPPGRGAGPALRSRAIAGIAGRGGMMSVRRAARRRRGGRTPAGARRWAWPRSTARARRSCPGRARSWPNWGSGSPPRGTGSSCCRSTTRPIRPRSRAYATRSSPRWSRSGRCGSATRFVSTLTGEPMDTSGLDAEYWYRNLRQPVRFAQATRSALGLGAALFVECSPHPVLGAGVAETAEAAELDVAVVGSLRRGEGGPDRFTRSLAEAYTWGRPSTGRPGATSGARLIDLPTYPFQRRQCGPAAIVSRPLPPSLPRRSRRRTRKRASRRPGFRGARSANWSSPPPPVSSGIRTARGRGAAPDVQGPRFRVGGRGGPAGQAARRDRDAAAHRAPVRPPDAGPAGRPPVRADQRRRGRRRPGRADPGPTATRSWWSRWAAATPAA